MSLKTDSAIVLPLRLTPLSEKMFARLSEPFCCKRWLAIWAMRFRESTLGVCGGEPCIVRMRIPVWVLEQARRLGANESSLLQSYPTLRASDLVSAWAYVRQNRQEIDRQIRENEDAT